MKYIEKLRANNVGGTSLAKELGITTRWAFYILSGEKTPSTKLIALMLQIYKFLKPADFFK